MQHSHIHLHVRDLARAQAFYGHWFGFRPRVQHGDIQFLRDEGGLDLALAPDPDPAPLPPWFHFGFRLEDGDVVRTKFVEMEASGVPMQLALQDYGDFVVFRCLDPDGYAIEVYWE